MNNTTDKECPCGTPRWMRVAGESNNKLYNIELDGVEEKGVAIPSECNLGTKTIVWFTVCLNCGHMQGDWPVRQDIMLSGEYTDGSDSITETESDNDTVSDSPWSQSNQTMYLRGWSV